MQGRIDQRCLIKSNEAISLRSEERPASWRLCVIQALHADKHIKVMTVIRRRDDRAAALWRHRRRRNFLHQRSFDGFYQRLKATIQANN